MEIITSTQQQQHIREFPDGKELTFEEIQRADEIHRLYYQETVKKVRRAFDFS